MLNPLKQKLPLLPISRIHLCGSYLCSESGESQSHRPLNSLKLLKNESGQCVVSLVQVHVLIQALILALFPFLSVSTKGHTQQRGRGEGKSVNQMHVTVLLSSVCKCVSVCVCVCVCVCIVNTLC